MRLRCLLPSPEALRCEGVEVADGLATIRVVSTQRACLCPCCGSPSTRVHSWYERRLSDLPWHGLEVRIRWRSRRFFCANADCRRRIFVERLPKVAEVRSRRTARLELTLRLIALACGGEPGARLAERLGMKASGDSLLRILRSGRTPDAAEPHIIGVDDWAYRRGRRYGTIICDLETHRPIDLLPDRSADSFQAWLVEHQAIQVVARDRGEYYARGATAGAPQAVQVADRWHLLRNLSDALRRLTDRHPRQITEAWRTAIETTTMPAPSVEAELPLSPPLAAQEVKFYRDARRRDHYEQVHLLHQQGQSQRAIGRQLGIHRETVQRYLHATSYPERARPSRRGGLDCHRSALWEHWRNGRRNAVELFHELKAAGFCGSYYMVGRCLRQWRSDPALAGSAPCQPLMPRPSARRVAWLLTRQDAELSAEERTFIHCLQGICPETAVARELGIRFATMVRTRRPDDFDGWLASAVASDSPRDLRAFACGLQRDLAAVRAALESPWSNGQTEGHVHRLKALKRQMYGRAGFDLLRIRVLNAA